MQRSYFIYVVVLLLLTVLRTATAKAVKSDNELVAERLLAQVAPTNATAAVITAAQDLHSQLANGSWADIDYKSQIRGAWSPEVHMGRVVEMAQAWRYGQLTSDVKNATLTGIRKAVDFWMKGDFKSPNWWDNEIGVPGSFSRMLLLLDNDTQALTKEELAFAEKDLERADWKGWTGANLADMIKTQIIRGLIYNQSSLVSGGFQRLWQEIFWAHQPYDNIQRDGSFHQHSDSGTRRGMLMSGSYGAVYTSDLLSMLDAARGTAYFTSNDTLAIFAACVLDGQQWYTAQNAQWDWTVIGRGNSGAGDHGVSFDRTFLRNMPVRQDEFVNYADCLDGVPSCKPLVGNRHYWDSDYMMHRRQDYAVSVHMYSNRTLPARCVNSQGKKNSRIGDGVTSVYATGFEYVDIFPVWDFRRLPGTTEELDTPLLPCEGYDTWISEMNYTSFVGGSSDGMYGTAAMDVWSGTLRKHGAWLFGDSAFVHMGAGIRCDMPGTDAGTTLANHLLEGAVVVQRGASGALRDPQTLAPGDYNLTDVQWLFHARYASGTRGTAYIPITSSAASLEVALVNRTGDWASLGTGSGSITRATLTVLARHGACPLSNVSLAYAVMPNVSLPEVEAFASSLARPSVEGRASPPRGPGPSVSILSNTHAVQGARMATTSEQDLTMAIFWDETSLELPGVVNVSAPCIIQMRRASGSHDSSLAVGETTVAVSSPVFAGNMTITLAAGLGMADRSCKLTQGNGQVLVLGDDKLSFSLPSGDYLGQTQVATCV